MSAFLWPLGDESAARWEVDPEIIDQGYARDPVVELYVQDLDTGAVLNDWQMGDWLAQYGKAAEEHALWLNVEAQVHAAELRAEGP